MQLALVLGVEHQQLLWQPSITNQPVAAGRIQLKPHFIRDFHDVLQPLQVAQDWTVFVHRTLIVDQHGAAAVRLWCVREDPAKQHERIVAAGVGCVQYLAKLTAALPAAGTGDLHQSGVSCINLSSSAAVGIAA